MKEMRRSPRAAPVAIVRFWNIPTKRTQYMAVQVYSVARAAVEQCDESDKRGPAVVCI